MLLYFKLFVNAVLLFTVPSIALYPRSDFNPTSMERQEMQPMPLQVDPLLSSYDSVMNLIDDLEDGELEKRCNESDLERINYFLVNLAAQGISNDPVDEFELQNDIQELLHGEENPYQYSFSLSQGNDYVVIPAIFYGHEEVILCKGWIQKKWEQAKKFVKKHKKAIIIGAAVVVATAVVVGVVVAAVSSASAAAAGAAAAATASASDKDDKSEADEPQPAPSALPVGPALSMPNEAPILESVIEESISNFKETVVEEELLHISDQSIGHEGAALGEKARNLGAALAHQTLDGISELAACIPQLLEEIKEVGHRFLPENLLSSQDGVEITPVKNFDSLIAAGHEKIDQVFSTEQASLYTNEAKEVNSQFAIGILPPPGTLTKILIDVDRFAEAGKSIDRARFTKAGRGLTKHGYREDSAFPRPSGTPEQVNEQGQKILESILNDPEKIAYERPHPDFGKVIEVVVPGKWGARFTANGEMVGFLEP